MPAKKARTIPRSATRPRRDDAALFRGSHGMVLTGRCLAMSEKAINDDGDYFRVPANEAWTVLQSLTVLYYLHETNPDNLLVRDKTEPTAPVSIAAVGMQLATLPVVVERGILIREFAAN